MYIQSIARELYRLQRDIDKLEQELAAAPHDRKDAIADELRRKKAEWQQVRNILDGAKARSTPDHVPPSRRRVG